MTNLENSAAEKKAEEKKMEFVENCVICFEDFTDEVMLSMTECNHIFHKECLKEWVKVRLREPAPQRPECPNCRTTIHMEKRGGQA